MKCSQNILIDELIDETNQGIDKITSFLEYDINLLNKKRQDGGWSILECLEHLNLYGDYYLVEIEKELINSIHPHNPSFKSGWLGDYSAKSMQPKSNGKLQKMKSPKDKVPSSDLPYTTIERCLKQQRNYIRLLELSRKKDLTKTRVTITLSKWITLRAGDCFRFVIYHNTRHINQAINTH